MPSGCAGIQKYASIKQYSIIKNKIRINSALFLFLKYVVYFFYFPLYPSIPSPSPLYPFIHIPFSLPFHSHPLSSLPFHSLPFSSLPFHSLPFSSFPFHSHSLSFIFPPLFSFPTLHYSLSFRLTCIHCRCVFFRGCCESALWSDPRSQGIPFTWGHFIGNTRSVVIALKSVTGRTVNACKG